MKLVAFCLVVVLAGLFTTTEGVNCDKTDATECMNWRSMNLCGQEPYTTICPHVCGKCDSKKAVLKREIPSKRQAKCLDEAKPKTCDTAKRNNLCTQGRMGGFGSSIRAKCKKT